MIHLTGAYGRQYTSYDEAIKDWKDGKDFKIITGPYCSSRDEDMMLKIYDEILIVLRTGKQHTLAENKRKLWENII